MNIEMKTETETTKTKIKPLKFTGNWFIDAGILGFVNLNGVLLK